MPQRRFILSCAGSFLLVLASASYAADMPAEVTINPMPEVPASPPADAVATPAPEAVEQSYRGNDQCTGRRIAQRPGRCTRGHGDQSAA